MTTRTKSIDVTAQQTAAYEAHPRAPFVRNPYNYDTNAVSDETGLKCEDPTLTQQQFVEESDINYIAERYGLTGELPTVLNLPRYGDFSGIFDFQTAQNAVRAAVEQFMTLPAKLRSRFDNQPQKLLAFLEDPENRAEAEFLGLVKKQEPETAQPPTGDAAGPGRGEPPTPPAEPAAEPTPKPSKKTT